MRIQAKGRLDYPYGLRSEIDEVKSGFDEKGRK
jgi:hypothetical protein